MEEVTYKPKFFSKERLIFFIIGIVVNIIFVFLISPNLSNIYNNQTSSELSFKILTIFSLSIPWIIFSFYTIFQLTGNKITIKENSLTFYNRELFTHWRIKSLLIDTISSIEDEKRTKIISSGRGELPISGKWILIEKKDGTKEEVDVNWYGTALKDFFTYLKTNYPNIKLNLHK